MDAWRAFEVEVWSAHLFEVAVGPNAGSSEWISLGSSNESEVLPPHRHVAVGNDARGAASVESGIVVSYSASEEIAILAATEVCHWPSGNTGKLFPGGSGEFPTSPFEESTCIRSLGG